jgi:pimeloyl-ACP methyl ester carboxylesterase
MGIPPIPGAEPIEVPLPGMTLRGFSVGPKDTHRKVLGLHGWIDNCATHTFTHKPWIDQGFQFISLDLPGHGRSDHRGLQDQYHAGSYALTVCEITKALGWADTTAFSLCSHSMSAGISSMVAGAMRDRIAALTLLEGIGMNTKAESQSANGLFTAYEARGTLLQRLQKASSSSSSSSGSGSGSGGGGKVYPTLDDAAKARVATVARYPGRQSIEFEAAKFLVTRGAKQASENGGYTFCHHARLLEPSSVYVSEAQMLDYLRRITAPTLCVTGSSGWPWPGSLMHGRIAAVPSMEHHHLVGGHHLHLDPSTAPTVAAVIGDWLKRNSDAIDARIEDAEKKAKQRAAELKAKKEAAAAGAASRHPVLVAGGGGGGGGAASVAMRGSLNPTAPQPGTEKSSAGDAVAADADAVRAANEIASSAAMPAGVGDSTSSSSSSSSSKASSAAPPLWTPRHIFIAHTEPFSPTSSMAVNASLPKISTTVLGHQHVHIHERVLVVDRVAAGVEDAVSTPFSASEQQTMEGQQGGSATTKFVYPRYGFPTGEHEEVVGDAGLKHYRHHVQENEPSKESLDTKAKREAYLSQLVWSEMPDHVAGLPHLLATAKRNTSSHSPAHGFLKGLKFGAFAPRIFLQAMPTLEAVTGVYSHHTGGGDAALKGLQAMEAKGSAY